MKKFPTTLAVLTAFATPAAVLTVFTTPVFAQAFCTCGGTGNVLKFTNNPITYQNAPAAIPAIGQDGLHAFAMAPRSGAAFNSNDPAATGGGSLGYNEMLRIY
jgi:hypothetical protein